MTLTPLVFGSERSSRDAQRLFEGDQESPDLSALGADGASSASSDCGTTLATLADAAERANHYAGRSKSQATINAYAAGWRDFLQFCERRGAVALPASDETVAGYLAELADAGLKAATIARRLVVISQAHKAADLPSPTTSSIVRRTHADIRRSIGTAQVTKAPAVVTDLKRMLDKLPGTRVGLRDRALLLLGFAGAFRRSELVALDVADLEFSSAGLTVTLRKSKTDQEGASRRIGIPFGSSEATCPVRAVQAWLETARIVDGPVFRATNFSGCSRGGCLIRPWRASSSDALPRWVSIRHATRAIPCAPGWRPYCAE